MNRGSPHRIIAIVLLFSGLEAASLQAEPRWGLGLQASQITTQSAEDREVDKSGTGFAGTLGATWTMSESSHLVLELGLGMKTVEGDSSSSTQEVETQGAFIGTSYRWAFSGFEIGPRLVVTRGDSASLRAYDADSTQTIVSLGPEIAYRFALESGDVLGFAAFTRDLLVKNQTNTHITAGLQFWLASTPSTADVNP